MVYHKEPCIKFSNNTNIKHLVKVLSIYSYYFLSYSKIKLSILSKTGFAVFLMLLNTIGNFLLLTPQKSGLSLKIEALLLLQNVMTETKKKKIKKNKTHIIVKSIYSSLRSESKSTQLFQNSKKEVVLNSLKRLMVHNYRIIQIFDLNGDHFKEKNQNMVFLDFLIFAANNGKQYYNYVVKSFEMLNAINFIHNIKMLNGIFTYTLNFKTMIRKKFIDDNKLIYTNFTGDALFGYNPTFLQYP
ncbi:hypothetical protein AGLY_001925 [Aphis glycines]|uniref:Uncharacterized protein n=1 Tax=Aphis glycines TaxID=307491 RepID=A0A6G0U4R8_APHGL|nr:hypothetical protein AGLY_001925 [Aphis glycines]